LHWHARPAKHRRAAHDFRVNFNRQIRFHASSLARAAGFDKTAFASALKWEVAELILLVRRLRGLR
jgi:hypothetical protein